MKLLSTELAGKLAESCIVCRPCQAKFSQPPDEGENIKQQERQNFTLILPVQVSSHFYRTPFTVGLSTAVNLI